MPIISEYENISNEDNIDAVLRCIGDERSRKLVEHYIVQEHNEIELRQMYAEFKPDTPSKNWRIGPVAVKVAVAALGRLEGPMPLAIGDVDKYCDLDEENRAISQQLDAMFSAGRLRSTERDSLRLLLTGLLESEDRDRLREVASQAQLNRKQEVMNNGLRYTDSFLVRGAAVFATHASLKVSFIDWFIDEHHDSFPLRTAAQLRVDLRDQLHSELEHHFSRR